MPSRVVRSTVRQTALRKNSRLQKEVRKALQETGKGLQKKHQEVVNSWKHKPKFGYRYKLKPDLLTVEVYAYGTNAKIWLWVDKGTRAHVIRARLKPMLRFQGGYSPKTQYRGKSTGGSGKASGAWFSKKEVRHPGTKGREFTEVIAEDYTPQFRKSIERAFRRGLKG